MATYTTKYGIGDRVVGLYEEWVKRIVRCATCGAKGVVVIGGEEFQCPKCEGKSRYPQHAGRRWFVGSETAVGKVEVEDLNGVVRITYMTWDTGVGTGRVWDEDSLFPPGDAQAECDRRNASTNWKDDPE